MDSLPTRYKHKPHLQLAHSFYLYVDNIDTYYQRSAILLSQTQLLLLFQDYLSQHGNTKGAGEGRVHWEKGETGVIYQSTLNIIIASFVQA